MNIIEGIDVDSLPIGFMNNKHIVYFIQQNKACIKIGITNDISRRLRDIQTGNPYTLGLVAMIMCDTRYDAAFLEKLFHEYFSFCRVHSEWFEYEHVKKWLIENKDIINSWWSREEITKFFVEKRRMNDVSI